MCHRIMAMRMSELVDAMERRGLTGRATAELGDDAPEAYPGSLVPLLVPGDSSDLATGSAASDVSTLISDSSTPIPSPEAPILNANAAAPVTDSLIAMQLTWGFESFDKKLVFNTRLDTALRQVREGRGMWADAILHGRCLVPVRGFYETSRSHRRYNPQTGKSVLQQYRFLMPGHRIFLMAGIQRDGRFSLVTTEPNAVVGSVHTRMPLVLGPGESLLWLGPDFAELADRSAIDLAVEPAD